MELSVIFQGMKVGIIMVWQLQYARLFDTPNKRLVQKYRVSELKCKIVCFIAKSQFNEWLASNDFTRTYLVVL